ncbi:TetR/AcrR family transcriptional regulator [Pseudonocardia spinosispora]|uniref:TetR/AcrR family transcriptional regulator n=1 Tax=Pseudonocardia spinosispora TaxID=103441 RepID=UPI00041B2C48|nr:TetR/AcrR family transcriptional regulator [Pseudonocardia spinosispora]
MVAATIDLLGEVGYAELSFGQIAKRAEVYRPAIYRRWPSKQHLVTDVLAASLGVVPTPDTGDLRRDLLTGIGTIAEGLTTPTLDHVLVPFVADLAAHPELREQFFERIFHARRSTTEATLRAAIARGEVREDIDMVFVLDALAAPLYFRQLFGHAPLDARLVEQTVDLVLAAIRGS